MRASASTSTQTLRFQKNDFLRVPTKGHMCQRLTTWHSPVGCSKRTSPKSSCLHLCERLAHSFLGYQHPLVRASASTSTPLLRWQRLKPFGRPNHARNKDGSAAESFSKRTELCIYLSLPLTDLFFHPRCSCSPRLHLLFAGANTCEWCEYCIRILQ